MNEYNPDLVPTREFKILHTLTTNPDASAADAVQQVLDMTTAEILAKEDTSGNDFEGDIPWNVSTLVIDIAMNTAPSQQAKLVDFVSQIQKVTLVDPRTGERVGCGNFGYLWTDLHSIGMNAADNLYSIIHDGTHPPEEIEKWENLTAYVAQSSALATITQNGQPSHRMDFLLYAMFACNDAFKGKHQHKSAVRAACLWFIYAAGSMLENCKIGRAYSMEDPPPRGFDMDRWHEWKLGLVFTRAGSRDESTRELIKRAREKIAEAEVERLN